jgi:nucleoside 2-deoxyribosyltransferase
MKKILIISSRSPRREDALSFLREACSQAEQRAGHKVNIGSVLDVKSTAGSIQEGIANTDIVLADVSGSRQDVMYELGFAHACEKPTILVSDESGKPTLYDLRGLYVHLYKKSGQDTAFHERLVGDIVAALDDPDKFTLKTSLRATPTTSPTVFVSYSRADLQCLERLQVHLRPLQRENGIAFWHDGTLKAGERWRDEIEAALARASIAVLLISADFLASKFVVESELPALLAAAEKLGTTILPVILKPCRFVRDAQLSVFQPINDPEQPLMGLSVIEQEKIYAQVAERIENELQDTN